MRSLTLLAVTLLVCAFAFASVNGSSTFDRLSDTISVQHIVTEGCVDAKPKGSPQYTCAQQKAWGKCSASWMKGYCKKTCGTCGGQTHPPAGAPAPAGGQDSLAALNINASPSRTAPIKSYGATYASRKKAIVSALQKAGFSSPQVKMMLAIAMLETNTFHPDQRDKKKTGDSTNYSQWNLNRDMLERGGVNLAGLNDWGHLNETAAALKKLLAKYGVNGFLNYLRGGYTGWKDGRSYGCVPYRTGIASIIKMLDQNPLLMSDDRRIDMVVQHV